MDAMALALPMPYLTLSTSDRLLPSNRWERTSLLRCLCRCKHVFWSDKPVKLLAREEIQCNRRFP